MKCKYCGKSFNSIYGLNAHKGLKHKNELLSQNVVVGKDVLDITYDELNSYRKNSSNRCMLCGKKETANTRPDIKTTPNKLCIDHNHNTKEFRGFICVQCNRNMGWLDRYHNQITDYNKPYKSKIKNS